MKHSWKIAGIAASLAAVMMTGCSEDNTEPVATVQPANAQVQSFVQVEQLARPGINEALLQTNAYMNIYNAVTPDFIRKALVAGSPENTAAAPVLAEATQTLGVFAALPGAPTVATVVGGFLPDVMRIDTTLNLKPIAGTEVQAYFHVNGNPAPSLVGGRKLTDDVIDDTVGYLTGGNVPGDKVPYYKPIGSTNPNIGHQHLNGQTTNFGPSVFPFLAPPN